MQQLRVLSLNEVRKRMAKLEKKNPEAFAALAALFQP
jgi:hypothetical protein